MRLTTVLLIATIMQVSAAGFAQKISLSRSNAPLKSILKELRTQTGYNFVVTDDQLNKAIPVNIRVTNLNLEDVLNQVFSKQPLTFSIDSKTVIVVDKEKTLIDKVKDYMKAYTLNGVVLNERNEPLAGANIMVLYNNRGTVTAKDGFFQFANIQGNERLITTYVGYRPDTLLIRNQERVTIKLVPLATSLSEVSVYNTGFQKLNKERATGSFGKPDMEVFAKRNGSMDLMTRLEGQVTGLSIDISSNNSSSNSNGNGVTTRKTLVRGRTTVQSTAEPLYVVNGVVVTDFSSVNNDDVEDITVLKDAAAAAIWGSRASNGVIVITTKSGNKNLRPTVTYSGFFNYMGKPDLSYGKTLNSQQFIQTAKEIFDPIAYPWASVSYSGVAPHEQILYDQSRGLITAAVANQRLDSLASTSNLSQIEDLFMRSSITNNHTVSVSAGNNVYSAYGSFGYTGIQNSTPGVKNNSYKLNLTQSLTAGDRLKITFGISLVNTIRSNNNMPAVTTTFLPYQLFRDEAGNNLSMNYLTGYSEANRLDYQARSRINLDYIPLNEVDLDYAKSNLLSINTSANATLKLWKGLSFVGTYGYQKTPGTGMHYTDNKTFAQRKQIVSLTVAPTTASTPVYNLPVAGGNYTTSTNDQRNFTIRNQMVYDAAVRKDRDHLTLQAGQDIQESFTSFSNTQLVGYDVKLGTYPVLDYAKLRTGISGTVPGYGSLYTSPYYASEIYTRFISYFGLANYTIAGKYSLDASWRQDYSNAFGKNLSTQNKPIWSFGTRWRLSQEKFMRSAKWIDELSLRATHGITGNVPTNATAVNDIYRAVASSSYTTLIAGDGLTLNTPANNTLSWEITHTTNIGIDYSLFNRRISGALNVYQKNTSDLVGDVPLNPWSGRTSVLGNIGKLVNKGIEISITSENVRSRDFSWSTNLNFTYNWNKLVSYSVPASYTAYASYRTSSSPYVVGYNMAPLFAYRYAGLDNMGDPQIYKADNTITKSPSAAQVEDLVYMGTTNPPFFGGFANTFSHKDFSLKINMVYNLGAVMRTDYNSFYSGRLATGTTFSGPNISTDFLDRWKQPGDEAFTNIPSYVASSSINSSRRNYSYYRYSDINVASSSYIKIRDVSLSYDVPLKATQFLKIQRASVFVQATNFMVWRANKLGIDPEVTRFVGTALPGHSYSMGVNVSF